MRFSNVVLASVLGSTAFSALVVEKEINRLTAPPQHTGLKAQHDTQVDTTEAEEQVEEEQLEHPTKEFSNFCSQDTYFVHSQAELDLISNQCTDIRGSIVINGYQSPIVDTGTIETIGGDIRISNATTVVRINLSKLAVISGSFQLNVLTSLTSINAPYLNTLGVIDWRILPILSTVNFETDLRDIKSITISDTSMTGFSGFDVENLETLNVNNNRFMESISSNIKGIGRKLAVSANARNAVVSFPNLAYANNITIRDVSSLNIQSIEAVNASMELINNNFQAVKFPKLKSVGGTLSLIENYNLRDAEFPSTEEIGGGLMVVNNTNVNKINFFPRLSIVGGAIEFVGNFREAIFGKLNLVRGSAIIKSTSDNFDCARWIRGIDQNGTQHSVIRGGKIICTRGSQQQVVKYGDDGAVIDEQISIIDDSESDAARVAENRASSSGVPQSIISFAVFGAVSYVLGF